jgi:two-component system, sensor histidine kinase and response regulator
MKLFHPRRLHYFQWKQRFPIIYRAVSYLQRNIFNAAAIPLREKRGLIPDNNFTRKIKTYFDQIKTLGLTPEMDEYEKSKLRIFNLINLFQLLAGIVGPILVLLNSKDLSIGAGLLACGPALISVGVLFMNSRRKHDAALILYFTLHPFFTSIIYMSGMDMGIELFFILYGILSVFFLQDIGHMLLSIGFSMINYFMLAVVLKNYQFQLNDSSVTFYLANELLGILFIFFGLYLIKKENTSYHTNILQKNDQLRQVNAEIEKQKKELTELNALKIKLFSVISHDLKTPMYALHNLFQNIQRQNIPPREFKALIPEVVNDINYTMNLMENLLHWAKSQMRSDHISPSVVDVSSMIHEVLHLLRLQADAKKIRLESRNNSPMFVYADKDMISIVLRNLLSNAIKFTPENGVVSIGASEASSFVEVFVQDTGMGMSQDVIKKVNSANYFTTKGTINESGTGLGLMLCREFLNKNGGQMFIESTEGKGSVISFTLPSAA